MLGAMRANAWYVRQVLSVLWRLIRPFALAMAGLSLLSLMVDGLFYGSLVQAPGVSLLDALVYFGAGYYGSQRTRLIRTGMLAAGATSVVGFIVWFTAAAIRTPSLMMAPFSKPFIFVILTVMLLLPLGYGTLVGALGGVIGRFAPPTPRKVRVS